MKFRIMIIWLISITALNFSYLIASAEKYELIGDKTAAATVPSGGQTESGRDPVLTAPKSPPVIERLFGPDLAGYDPASEEYIRLEQSEKLNLSDLFVLDKLFNGQSALQADRSSLGDLFILDQLFNGGNFLKNSRFDLGDLFVLDRLFRDDQNLLNRDNTNLGDILILDQLFGD